jgi:hypothetical protein
MLEKRREEQKSGRKKRKKGRRKLKTLTQRSAERVAS